MTQMSTITEPAEMLGSEEVKREDEQEKDLDELCFPILAEEIDNIAREEDYYLILADEIESSVKSELAKAKKAEEAKRENKGGSEFISFLAKELTEKLKKDHVEVAASNGSIESLFKLAIDYGEIDTNNAAKGTEYARQMAMKLRFQLMLRGESGNEVVTDLIIGELTKELFGVSSIEKTVTDDEVISASSDIAESDFNENPTEEVAGEEMEEQVENNNADEDEEDTETESTDTEDADNRTDAQQYRGRNDTPTVGGSGYDNLYDALKGSGGRIPQKKITNGDKKEYVDDLEKIKTMEGKLSLDERILYASRGMSGLDQMQVGLLIKDEFKRRENGFLDVKHKLFNLRYMILMVTETKVICVDDYSYNVIRFDKADVAAINGIFTENGSFSFKVSQIQVQLNNNKVFIINRYFPSKDKFDAYLNGFTDLMNQ